MVLNSICVLNCRREVAKCSFDQYAFYLGISLVGNAPLYEHFCLAQEDEKYATACEVM